MCEAKCIKCGKFGHMNTDKRCPLYGKAVDAEAPIQNIDQDKLIQEMRAEGLAMRWSAWDMNKAAGGAASAAVMQEMVETERNKTGPVDRAEVLKSMSKEEKKALLKKLEKMDKKKKKKAKKEKKKKKSYSSDSESESEDDRRQKKDKRRRSRSREDRHRERSRSREDRRDRRDRSRSRDRKYRRDSSEEDRHRRRRSRSSDRRRDSRRS